MARPKDDLSKLSLNQLEVLTGATYRSIKKWLSDKGLEPLETGDNSILYDPREALPIIFEAQNYKVKTAVPTGPLTENEELEISKKLDPFIQRARKDRAQADKYEFELDVLRKKYVPADETEKMWNDLMVSFRTKILAIGPQHGVTLFGIKNQKEFISKLDEIHHQALEALSGYDITDETQTAD